MTCRCPVAPPTCASRVTAASWRQKHRLRAAPLRSLVSAASVPASLLQHSRSRARRRWCISEVLPSPSFQIAAVTEAGALEIITALELQSPSFHERTRVEALINTALCGPLNIPRGEIKVCHTLAKAALSAIVQNMLAA